MAEPANETVACRAIALSAQSSDQTVKSSKAVERPGMLSSWKSPVMTETLLGPVDTPSAEPSKLHSVTVTPLALATLWASLRLSFQS